MPGVVGSSAHFITGQLNRVCYFHVFDIFLASKGSNWSELSLFRRDTYTGKLWS